jgi:hypothetical protein
MRKFSFLFLFYVSCLAASGQHLSYTRYELLRLGGLREEKKLDEQYDDIKGDAYFYPEWLYGAVTSKQGSYKGDLKLKFDQYANKLYANLNDTVYDLSSAPINSFRLYPNYPDTSVHYLFRNGFVTGNWKPELFLQVLAEGQLTFLKQQTILLKDVHDESLVATVKKFIGQHYYYSMRSNGQVMDAQLNKNALERQTGDKWTAVSAWLKKGGKRR